MTSFHNVEIVSESFIKPKHITQVQNKPVYLNQWDLTMLFVHYIQKGLLFNKPPFMTQPTNPHIINIQYDKNPAAGDFTTIQDAIDSLPFINLVRVSIKVHAGVYTEKVNIPPLKSFISIEGAGAEKTIVQWGDRGQTLGPKGKPIGTYASATFAVNSPYFIAKNITFKNTTAVPAPGAIGKQAVAFRISADTAAFWGCRFLGAQDTLYDHRGS